MARPQEDVRTGPTKRLAEWLNANWEDRCSFTNAQVADKFGYKTPNVVSMWRTGKTTVAIERLPQICDLLRVDIEQLFPLYIEQYIGDKPEVWARYVDMFQRLTTKGEAQALQAVRDAMEGASVPALTPSQRKAFAMIAKDPEFAKSLVESKEAA